MDQHIVDVVAARAVEGPDEPAIVEKRLGIWRTVSIGELQERVETLAAGLAARGVGHGSVVVLALHSSSTWLAVDLACQRLGARVVAVEPSRVAEDLEVIAGRLSPAVVVAQGQHVTDAVFDVFVRRGRPVPVVSHVNPVATWPDHADRLVPIDELRGGSGTSPNPVPGAGVIVPTRDDRTWPVLGRDRIAAGVAAVVGELGLAPHDRVFVDRHLAAPNEPSTSAYPALVSGALLVLPESVRAARAARRETQPTVLHLQARELGDLAGSILARMEASRGLKGALCHRWTRRLDRQDAPRSGLLDRVVTTPLLYDQGLAAARTVLVSGGDLDDTTLRLWRHLGVPVRSIHLVPAASGPLTMAGVDHDPGSRGPVLGSVEAAVSSDGRLRVRGATVDLTGIDASGEEVALPDQDGWVTTDDVVELPDDELHLVGPPIMLPFAGVDEAERAIRGARLVREAALVPAEDDGEPLHVVVDIVEEVAGRIAADAGQVWTTRSTLVEVDAVRDAVVEQVRHALDAADDVRVTLLPTRLEELPGALEASGAVDRHVLARHLGIAPASAERERA